MPHVTYDLPVPTRRSTVPRRPVNRSSSKSKSSSSRSSSSNGSISPPPPPVDAPDFLFCVELGLVVRSRKHNHKTIHDLEAELSRRFRQAGIGHMLASKHPLHGYGWDDRSWVIATEPCIRSRPSDYRFGMKFVSPFMSFIESGDSWQQRLDTVMAMLNENFELTTSHQCFTHIHIAPVAGYWEFDQVQGLAKSALYFERCLDELVPPYRRNSIWAKSIRNNHYFGSLSMIKAFDRVDTSPPSFLTLPAMMNWCSKSSPTGEALGRGRYKDFAHNTFRWNFQNIDPVDGRGTVEFRQPPGCTTIGELVGWVQLIGCLARLSCGHDIDPAAAPKLKSLGKWLMYEAKYSNVPNTHCLKALLKQATPVTSVPGVVPGADPEEITIEEDQRLKWEANNRNLVMEQYRTLMLIY
ncbi:hypothetical protein B0J18DRAFT_242177 [Chaetomium sp. MPI-SDFR-AT-0129]|nr:hypothetical protein B0J18DRAFT_242177 [Chaetomium sp. MPI-SDFR-AT-0129]